MMQLQPMLCPRCGKPLDLEKHAHGGLWRCPQCSGVAANLTVLRRQLEEDVVRDFWRKAADAGAPSERKCPSCSRPLREFVARHEDQSLRLDLCKQCQLMWFDPGELETFPKVQRVQPADVDRQIALAQMQTGAEMEASMNDEHTDITYYVEVGVAVIIALLRLFCRR
jgi:Zn-finger nucleic acid-binding protein